MIEFRRTAERGVSLQPDGNTNSVRLSHNLHLSPLPASVLRIIREAKTQLPRIIPHSRGSRRGMSIGSQFKVWPPRSISHPDSLNKSLSLSSISSLRLRVSLSLLSQDFLSSHSLPYLADKLGEDRIGLTSQSLARPHHRRRKVETPLGIPPWPRSLSRPPSSSYPEPSFASRRYRSGDWAHQTPECITRSANSPLSTDTPPRRRTTCGCSPLSGRLAVSSS